MQHVAIMSKKGGYIEDILSGLKTIESRWYVNRCSPWDKIKKEDVIFFKESGGMVLARAEVKDVLQISGLNKERFEKIVDKYAGGIRMRNRNYEIVKNKRYCILMFLKNVERIEKPFNINKKGFGVSSAWMCVEDINEIKI